MTLEELQAEAHRQGYKLVRITPANTRWLPCKCGYTGRCRNKITENSYIRTCPECGFSVTTTKDRGIDTQLKEVWNEAIRNVSRLAPELYE